MRTHRVATTAWVVAGAAAMVLTGMSLAHEMANYPGGAQALGASVAAAAEAMRPLRWPAERLDTLGGYLTFHNVTMVTYFVTLYAAMLGARVVRGWESEHSLEMVLATGWSRRAVVRDRALGATVVLAVIAVGLGAGVAVAMAAGGAPDAAGSMATMAASGLAGFLAMGLGVLVSQLVGSPRAAAGVSALVLTVLYVATNVWEEIGPIGLVRFVSPYYYANESRALVPGHGFSVVAAVTLVVLGVALLAVSAWLFERRDYGGVAWKRRVRAQAAPRPPVAWRPLPLARTVTTALLARGWVGLAAWTASAVALVALLVTLQQAVMDVWTTFSFTAALAGGTAGTAEEQYLAFTVEVLAPIVAAYVVTQSATWLADLSAGRVEAVLASPVSWTRLVLERMAAVTAGVAVITAVALGALVVGERLVGTDASVGGVARVGLACVLLGAAVAGVASVLVVWLRTQVAVVALAVYLGASYLLTVFVPMVGWSDGLLRLSVLWAFGHPYLDWPPLVGWGVLLVLAVGGGAVASFVAERTPKVA